MKKRILISLFLLLSGKGLVCMELRNTNPLETCYRDFACIVACDKEFHTEDVNKRILDLCNKIHVDKDSSRAHYYNKRKPVNPFVTTLNASLDIVEIYKHLDKIIQTLVDFYRNKSEWRKEAAQLASEYELTYRSEGLRFNIAFNLLQGSLSKVNCLISAIHRNLPTSTLKDYIDKYNLQEVVNQPDQLGYKPLYYAVKTDNHDIIKLIGEYGVNINDIVDPFGRTAMHIATKENIQTSVVQALIELGANIFTQDRRHRAPAAQLKKQDDKLKLLADANETTECPICYEEFGSTRQISARACGHVFCSECNSKLSQQDCPICRS